MNNYLHRVLQMPSIMSQKIKDSFFYTPLNPYFLAKNYLRESMIACIPFVNGKVLDIGCGKKPYEKLFQEKSEHYFGLDYPEKGNNLVKMDMIGDAQHLPVKSDSINSVICNQLLEHLPESNIFFSEVSRVLKKNGYLILTVPFFWGLHEEPRDYFRFTKYGLEHLCNKHKLEVIKIEKLGGYFSMIIQRFNDLVVAKIKNILILYIMFIPIFIFNNIVALLLDKLTKNYGDNLDWLLIAKKR